jgi:hypothetical protein
MTHRADHGHDVHRQPCADTAQRVNRKSTYQTTAFEAWHAVNAVTGQRLASCPPATVMAAFNHRGTFRYAKKISRADFNFIQIRMRYHSQKFYE